MHRTTLSRRFRHAQERLERIPLRPLPRALVLVLDGTKIAPRLAALIAYEHRSNQPLAWAFVERETFAAWHRFLGKIKDRYAVAAVVSDGQKGLKKALLLLVPTARRQRCVAHVVRRSLALLTRRPQSEAGQELRQLVCALGQVKVRRGAVRWRAALLQWDARHALFLAEKSINPTTGRRWYTHRKLRAVRSLLLNALPDLFHYTADARIPNTTNEVEGGINAPLKELLGRHRGITVQNKRLLVSHFLYGRRMKKSPTRNAT